MKIAITSQNFKSVTNHAGKARRFLVFEIIDGQEPQEIDRISLPKEMAFHELAMGTAHPIDGVDALLSASFGAGFARKMAARHITASLTEETDPLKAIEIFLAKGQVLPSGGCGGHHH